MTVNKLHGEMNVRQRGRSKGETLYKTYKENLMVTKFTKKELQRLKCTDDEIELVMEYQKRFPIILYNEDNMKKFCIDAHVL